MCPQYAQGSYIGLVGAYAGGRGAYPQGNDPEILCALQPLPQTFAMQGLSHQTHLMLLDELAQIDEGVAHASQ